MGAINGILMGVYAVVSRAFQIGKISAVNH